MGRTKSDLERNFVKVDALVAEINMKVPPASDFGTVQLRADLAGLLVVALAATYETCVKEILCGCASRHHAAFGEFAERNFERLNSRIQINDLSRYCGLFDPSTQKRFKDCLEGKKKRISRLTGINIVKSFERILDWRHDFAHAWGRNTTIEEAIRTHRFARHVMYAFEDAFRV